MEELAARPQLIRGAVYRLSLAPDGRLVQGPPSELFKSANRYRDIALNPDGRTLYLATDPSGPSRDAAGVVSQKLANPGSILELKDGNLAASTVIHRLHVLTTHRGTDAQRLSLVMSARAVIEKEHLGASTPRRVVGTCSQVST